MLVNNVEISPWAGYLFQLARAEGSRLWDSTGKEYIDFTSGWNVTNLGWNDPVVREAIIKQAEKNVYNPMWTTEPIQEAFAQALVAELPKHLTACCKATGGTEAVEMSVKIARAATGRTKIAGFSDSYHGQLFASMALGYRPDYVKAIAPLVPDFVQLDYQRAHENGDMQLVDVATLNAELDEALSGRDVAALIIEPGMTTGWGSCYMMPNGFLEKARELTTKYGTLLIFDEVGTGFGRTGKLFGYQHSGVEPDAIIFAKGMTNGGAAMGTVVTREDVVEPKNSSTNLTSTFGWTPLACAASLATLQRHKELETADMAAKKGDYVQDWLRTNLEAKGLVTGVRGMGLEIGLDMVGADKTARLKQVMSSALDRGLHLTGDMEQTLVVMPPLTIEQSLLDQGLAILAEVISN